MSTGSSLRRARERANRHTHHQRPHAPHAATRPPIPESVAVVAPICDCGKSKSLVCCRCCGAMEWECSREPLAHDHVRVKVVPPAAPPA